MSQPVAYSYIRFSAQIQHQGDSLRRQTALTRKWCKENGAHLDESLTYRDLGRSAFRGAHRENADKHALAAFLNLVEDGKVPPGSYLVVEALDRLSREQVRSALMLLLGLIEKGIRIVQLIPNIVVYDKATDDMALMYAIMEFRRGHSESLAKSQRLGESWKAKREKARNGKSIMTRRIPCWLEFKDGKLKPIPEKVKTIRYIFKLCLQGVGTIGIVRRLVEEKVPPIAAKWGKMLVHRLLTDGRVIGTLQPKNQFCEPVGEPIAGYYPAIVPEKEFQRAQALHQGNIWKKGGRLDSAVLNLFSGMVKDPITGLSYTVETRKRWLNDGGVHRTMISRGQQEGTDFLPRFPADSFEQAILARLVELNADEIFGDNGGGKVEPIAAELAAVESRIAGIEAELTNGEEDIPAIMRSLRTLEERKRSLIRDLAEARAESGNPAKERLGAVKGLADAIHGNREARLRLRSALRSLVEAIFVIVVPRPERKSRFCVAQIFFRGSEETRHYLIFHKHGAVGVPPFWTARTETFGRTNTVDLRRPEHAKALRQRLENIDLKPFLTHPK